MILIADGGATKTHWKLYDTNRQYTAETIGISPVHTHPEDHYDALNARFRKDFPAMPDEVYFYGAGCASPKLCARVEALLHKLFPEASVVVESDMLGAARALLGNKQGIACILGTGSNSCLYDGASIKDQVPALGYILGDEGSGAVLGREILNRYFKRDFPPELKQEFEEQHDHTLEVVLPNIYQQASPSRYLAEFSRFIYNHLWHPYIRQLAKDVFRSFIRRNISAYPRAQHYPVAFAGSVGWYYQYVIQEVAQEEGFQTGAFMQSPIEGLSEYHLTIKNKQD